MSVPTILNQGKTWNCAPYAILGALLDINPDIDWRKIEKEINEENRNNLSMVAAGNWFIKKGYIKWYRNIPRTPFLIKRQPIIVSTKNGDWVKSGKPPYIWSSTPKITWHFWFLPRSNTVDPNRIKFRNQYGEEWGDKWHCYIQYKDIRKFAFFEIVI